MNRSLQHKEEGDSAHDRFSFVSAYETNDKRTCLNSLYLVL